MIGIFDSGLGGLIALKEIKKILPDYSYIYLGDSLRSPYGGRSQEAIYEFTEKAVDFLFQRGCKLVIIACNTASAEALHKIQQEYLPRTFLEKKMVRGLPQLKDEIKNVLGAVYPLAEEAIQVSQTKRIGVVGTKATINSKVYEKELKKISKDIKIFQQACPLLVPLIEESWHKKPESKKILKKYLWHLKNKNIDTLILGCTHYPLLIKEFQKIMGQRVQVLDSSKIIAKKLKDYLSRHPEINKVLEQKLSTSSSHSGKKREYLVTDLNQNFKKMAEMILGQKVNFKKVDLEDR